MLQDMDRCDYLAYDEIIDVANLWYYLAYDEIIDVANLWYSNTNGWFMCTRIV